MKILILSDLHIGNKARAKELCPYPEGSHKDSNLVESFIDTIKSYQKQHGNIDKLIIPGDITNHSNLVEYFCGSDFLKKLMDELNLDLEKIIFVPGNHDVDWSVLEGKNIPSVEKEKRKTHKYNTIKDTDHLVSQLISDELFTSPFIRKWEFEDSIFYGFNSSWHDDAILENHYGLIQAEHIKCLEDMISKELRTDKMKFFVVHHHLYQIPNPHPSWRDLSTMQNSQLLLEVLVKYNFNFIIHGHRHQPNFLTTTINGSSQINILSAGSYSCEVPTDIAGEIGNLFHVLEIDNIAGCKGRIKTWAYTVRNGWVESKKENHGIEHVNPFGCSLDYNVIKDNCISEINSRFEKESYVNFGTLRMLISELNYLQIPQCEKLFKDIELNCSAKGTVDLQGEIIFIKK